MLDQHQQFHVLGLCRDAVTTQLTELILTNALGFRPSGSHSNGVQISVHKHVRCVVYNCQFLVARSFK